MRGRKNITEEDKEGNLEEMKYKDRWKEQLRIQKDKQSIWKRN